MLAMVKWCHHCVDCIKIVWQLTINRCIGTVEFLLIPFEFLFVKRVLRDTFLKAECEAFFNSGDWGNQKVFPRKFLIKGHYPLQNPFKEFLSGLWKRLYLYKIST